LKTSCKALERGEAYVNAPNRNWWGAALPFGEDTSNFKEKGLGGAGREWIEAIRNEVKGVSDQPGVWSEGGGIRREANRLLGK